MTTPTVPVRPGSVSTQAIHEADLKTRVWQGKTQYILVKASGVIAAAAGKVLAWDDASAGTVDAVAGAAATKGEVAGVVPSNFVGGIASGDYLVLERAGISTINVAGAVAAAAALAVHGAAGAVDDTTVTDATTIAWANVAAASGTVEATLDLP